MNLIQYLPNYEQLFNRFKSTGRTTPPTSQEFYDYTLSEYNRIIDLAKYTQSDADRTKFNQGAQNIKIDLDLAERNLIEEKIQIPNNPDIIPTVTPAPTPEAKKKTNNLLIIGGLILGVSILS